MSESATPSWPQDQQQLPLTWPQEQHHEDHEQIHLTWPQEQQQQITMSDQQQLPLTWPQEQHHEDHEQIHLTWPQEQHRQELSLPWPWPWPALEQEQLMHSTSQTAEGIPPSPLQYLEVPGIRFVPSDIELIIDYLEPKLRGERLPTDLVHVCDVYSDHPKELMSKLGRSIEGNWYMFSPRNRKYTRGKRPSRNTSHVGFWKSTSRNEPILAVLDEDGTNKVIGYKGCLTYHESDENNVHESDENNIHESDKNNMLMAKPKKEAKPKPKKKKAKPKKDIHESDENNVLMEEQKKERDNKTPWKMWEFVCSDSDRPFTAEEEPMRLNDWVLCKVTYKETCKVTKEKPQPPHKKKPQQPHKKKQKLQEEQQPPNRSIVIRQPFESGSASSSQHVTPDSSLALAGGDDAATAAVDPTPLQMLPPFPPLDGYYGDLLYPW